MGQESTSDAGPPLRGGIVTAGNGNLADRRRESGLPYLHRDYRLAICQTRVEPRRQQRSSGEICGLNSGLFDLAISNGDGRLKNSPYGQRRVARIWGSSRS